MEIYVDLKNLLEKRGISAYELAKKVEITYPTILSIMNNKKNGIRWDTLSELCKALECEPGDIIKLKK